MKTRILTGLLMALAMGLAWQSANGQHHLKHPSGITCEPGFKIVEEIVMQDVERYVVKLVPVIPKKWVYDWVDDPFAIQDSKHGQCSQAYGPYCRKQLVKMQVDNPCLATTKAVTEKIVERVPVTVYRQVPIGSPNIETIPTKPKSQPK